MKKVQRVLGTTLIAGFIMAGTTGCVKPYMKPVFQTIQASQTAFLVPLVGDTNKQGAFESEELLAKTKVATKEIEIPQRWVQTGRRNYQGEYKPSATVILVDRNPVTREWTSNKDTGTSAKDEGIKAETKESIAFTANVACTAQIDEHNATKFLYRYNNVPLSQVMDTEIKTKVHSTFIEESAKYNLDELLLNKQVIMDTVRNTCIPYFEERGITITALGLSGDFLYKAEIQASIDAKFTAEKSAEAQRIKDDQTAKSQKVKNETEIATAKAEAEAIKIRQETFQKQLEMKEIEVQEKWIEAWKSGGAQMPQYIGGADTSMIMMPSNK